MSTAPARRDAIAAEMADAAEQGQLTPIGPALHGQAATDAARALLMAATGTTSPQAASEVALGRPRVGETRQETRHWRVRVPASLDDAVKEQAAAQGVTVSDVVRRLVAAVLIPPAN